MLVGSCIVSRKSEINSETDYHHHTHCFHYSFNPQLLSKHLTYARHSEKYPEDYKAVDTAEAIHHNSEQYS